MEVMIKAMLSNKPVPADKRGAKNKSTQMT